jgi:uncharacterized hydrophobic protein (TIGR00271 family)
MSQRADILAGWRVITRSLAKGVDRDTAYADICESGGASGRYVMMSVLSAAIATLGLLLSSPAVVIGAMLISPLMSPIILLGFSFWTVDWSATRRALNSLVMGLGIALVVAVLLTWVSPLKEPTAEILARTRPNLFDLLVAAFSGLAGGYAVIRQRGETVIGVAIATALMPPIATIGFGIGTTNWTIALGSLLLFATNLIAIALAAAFMAALYGFHPKVRPGGANWVGRTAVVLVVAALCVPLTVSLNSIAQESRATVAARAEIQKLFGDKARLTTLTVRSTNGGLQVGGLVATPIYIASAAADIEKRLAAVVGVKAHVSLDQVVLTDPERFAADQDQEQSPARPDPTAAAVQALRDAVPFPAQSIAYDPSTRQGFVLLDPASGLDIATSLKLEQGLRAREGLDQTVVVPPVQALAPVPVALAAGEPPQLASTAAADIWALQRWRAPQVVATFCGPRRRQKEIEAVVVAALQPIPVQVTRGASATCGGATPTPFILLAPG